MRLLLALLLGLLASAAVAAQGGARTTTRYGVELDPARYSQKTPLDTLRSVLKALDEGRVYYLVAQLADPAYVDERVREQEKRMAGTGTKASRQLVAFDAVVKEVAGHFRDDPSLIRELREFARDGKWDEAGAKATAGIKGTARKMFFRKLDERWFLENRRR
jgi:hypothetical protein